MHKLHTLSPLTSCLRMAFGVAWVLLGVGGEVLGQGVGEPRRGRVVQGMKHEAKRLEFIPNGGQWPEEVVARTSLGVGQFWLERNGWVADVRGPGFDALTGHGAWGAGGKRLEGHAWRVTWEGSASEPEVVGEEPVEQVVNYYLGADPGRWASGLVPVERMRLREVWAGVEVRMHGDFAGRNRMKYDFVVAPGADAGVVRLLHAGTVPRLEADGSLVHALGKPGEVWGEIRELPPFAYQILEGQIHSIPCSYTLQPLPDGTFRVGFALGAYDATQELVIDPELVFASFIGSTADSWGVTAGYDPSDRLIGGSGVLGQGYPTTAGAWDQTFGGGWFDVGLSFFDADGGGLAFSTYIGGTGMDFPHSIVSDDLGNIFLMGTTGSANFPTTAGAAQGVFTGGPPVDLGANQFYGSYDQGSDIFVVKLSGANGSLLASTFMGGGGNDGLNLGVELNYNYGDVCRGEIAIDALGAPWVATTTSSSNFTMVGAFDGTLSGATDAVIFRLSPDLGTLTWSSYLGGSSDDSGYGIQFAQGSQRVYVTGGTRSNSFPSVAGSAQPTYGGGVDGFLALLEPSGAGWGLTRSTYIGSSAYDQSYFVQLDTEDRPYACGQTTGNLSLVGPVYAANPNGSTFVAQYAPDLASLTLRTRVGLNQTSVDISPTAFLVSDCDEIYISGWGGETNTFNSAYITNSTTTGMPTTPDAEQLTTDGSDFWLGVLSPGAAALTYGTFFGGSFSNEHVDGGTSRFDKNGTVYQAVCAGCGGFDDFPTTGGVWSPNNLASNCNLGVFKFNLGSLAADIDIEAPDVICPGEPVSFVNTSIGGTTYEWFFGDLDSSTEENPTHTYLTAGEWEVMLVVSAGPDGTGCLAPDTAYATLFVADLPNPSIDEVGVLCGGESVTLQAWGTGDLAWNPHPTLTGGNTATPTVTPTTTTTYTVEDSNECGAATASVTVVVGTADFDITPSQPMCLGDVVDLALTGAVGVTWSPTVGLGTPGAPSTTASPPVTTTYTAYGVTAEGCEGEETVTLYVVPSAPGGEVYPEIFLCAGQGVYLQAAEGDSYLWSPATSLSNPLLPNPYALPSASTTYAVSIANVCGVGVDSVTVTLITPSVDASGGGWMCRGESMTLTASPGVNYSWNPASLAGTPTAQTTVVFPVESTTFTVFVTDDFGCTASSQIEVGVWQPPYVDAGPDREIDWLDETRLFGTVDADTFWWSPPEALSCSDCLTPVVLQSEPGWFVLSTISDQGCIGRDSVHLEVFFPVYVPTAFTPNQDGINDVFRVEGVEPRGYRLEIFNRWGEMVFWSTDPEEPWLGNEQVKGGEHYVPDGVYSWRLRFELRDGPYLLEGPVTLVR